MIFAAVDPFSVANDIVVAVLALVLGIPAWRQARRTNRISDLQDTADEVKRLLTPPEGKNAPPSPVAQEVNDAVSPLVLQSLEEIKAMRQDQEGLTRVLAEHLHWSSVTHSDIDKRLRTLEERRSQ